jgi:hypothetical protein
LVHEALLYQNREHFGDVVAGFASEAARVREPVLVVLPALSHDLVRSAAAPSGADLHFEDMSARGRNPTCLLDLFGDWIDEHDGPVRVIDEPIWPGRSHAEVVEVLRHEALAGRRRPAAGAAGGRGLWLINQLCDLVELRTGDSGTTLRMHLQDATA